VGISSTGFINQLRNGLPKHQRYLAVTKQLRKSREYAINPFDIKVGLTRPLETEKNQMASFLTSLLTPKEKREPYNGTYNFVMYLITEVFESVNEGEEKGASKIYRYGYAPELDDYLTNNNIIRYGTKQVPDGFGGFKRIVDGDDIESVSYYELTRRLHVIGTKFVGDERALAWRARDAGWGFRRARRPVHCARRACARRSGR
jgi:intracellular multiplication protein IcmB